MGYCDANGVCHEDDCECETCMRSLAAEINSRRGTPLSQTVIEKMNAIKDAARTSVQSP